MHTVLVTQLVYLCKFMLYPTSHRFNEEANNQEQLIVYILIKAKVVNISGDLLYLFFNLYFHKIE